MTLFLRSQSRSNFTAQLGFDFRRLFIPQSWIQPQRIKTLGINEPFLSSRSQMMMDDTDAAQESHNDPKVLRLHFTASLLGLTPSLRLPYCMHCELSNSNHGTIWNFGSISSMHRGGKETFECWPWLSVGPKAENMKAKKKTVCCFGHRCASYLFQQREHVQFLKLNLFQFCPVHSVLCSVLNRLHVTSF